MPAQSSTASDRSSQFWQGARDGVPVLVASAPFGVLYGVLATQQGLSVFDTVLMSATIFAGASQMVGIELFGQDIPAWVGSPWHVSIGAIAGILIAAMLTPATPQAFHDPEPDDVGGGP